jgi:hypothetical protein
VKRSLAALVGGTLAIWVATAYPARLLWGDTALLLSAVAAAVCLVPAVGTLMWSAWALEGSPERQFAAVFGGTGVRMVVAVGTGLLLYNFVPALGQTAFLIWVIVFYLVTLTLEIGILVRRLSAARPPHP